MLELEMQNYLRRYHPGAFRMTASVAVCMRPCSFGLGICAPRSGEDQEPIVWYFFIEQAHEKLWS